jgi:hypothetical protein
MLPKNQDHHPFPFVPAFLFLFSMPLAFELCLYVTIHVSYRLYLFITFSPKILAISLILFCDVCFSVLSA